MPRKQEVNEFDEISKLQSRVARLESVVSRLLGLLSQRDEQQEDYESEYSALERELDRAT